MEHEPQHSSKLPCGRGNNDNLRLKGLSEWEQNRRESKQSESRSEKNSSGSGSKQSISSRSGLNKSELKQEIMRLQDTAIYRAPKCLAFEAEGA